MHLAYEPYHFPGQERSLDEEACFMDFLGDAAFIYAALKCQREAKELHHQVQYILLFIENILMASWQIFCVSCSFSLSPEVRHVIYNF